LQEALINIPKATTFQLVEVHLSKMDTSQGTLFVARRDLALLLTLAAVLLFEKQEQQERKTQPIKTEM
jgi:hypothetical protein